MQSIHLLHFKYSSGLSFCDLTKTNSVGKVRVDVLNIFDSHHMGNNFDGDYIWCLLSICQIH